MNVYLYYSTMAGLVLHSFRLSKTCEDTVKKIESDKVPIHEKSGESFSYSWKTDDNVKTFITIVIIIIISY